MIFITGTDTGAGKTVLTRLLLEFLRSQGINALAMKPVCTGSREDVSAIQRHQPRLLTDDEVNPFHYPLPAAPLLSARSARNKPTIKAVTDSINAIQKKCDVLLVEGAGGLLVPLTEKETWMQGIQKWSCQILIAAPNRLGVINHAALTVQALESAGIEKKCVILMDSRNENHHGRVERENGTILGKMLKKTPVCCLPNLGRVGVKTVKKAVGQKKIKKVLAEIIHLR